MEIKSKVEHNGIKLNVKKDYELIYPPNIWSGLKKETKESLRENLSYLKLAPYASFLDEPFFFDSRLPFLKPFLDRCAMIDLPRFAFEDKIKASFLENNFKKARFHFSAGEPALPGEDSAIEEGVILAISLGKDSLLSYGVAKELGLPLKMVFFEDSWDVELIHKRQLMKKFQKEFKEEIGTVYDGTDRLPSDQSVNVIKSHGIFGCNAVNGYMAMLLPFAYHYRMKYIAFGNEQSYNDTFTDNEGHKTYVAYDQSSMGMQEQNNILNKFTDNKIQLTSLVEPIYNIAEVKILFNRYPKIAGYQMSCPHSDAENKSNRWCYSCPTCAKAFLYMAANGVEPKKADFKVNFFDEKFKNLYPLFNNSLDRIFEKPKAVRDEQLLAFYLAFRNGNKGSLIDKFRGGFLKEAIEREDELCNKFLKIYDAVSIPGKMKREVNSIYKEELSK